MRDVSNWGLIKAMLSALWHKTTIIMYVGKHKDQKGKMYLKNAGTPKRVANGLRKMADIIDQQVWMQEEAERLARKPELAVPPHDAPVPSSEHGQLP